MSYDPLQGTNQIQDRVMGYSIICLSRSFHSRGRRSLRRKIFTFQMYGKRSFLRQYKKAMHGLNIFTGNQKGKCVYVWVYGDMCVRSETQRKRCVSPPHPTLKRPLYIEVTRPAYLESLYFWHSSMRSNPNKDISSIHILSFLCQLTALCCFLLKEWEPCDF